MLTIWVMAGGACMTAPAKMNIRSTRVHEGAVDGAIGGGSVVASSG